MGNYASIHGLKMYYEIHGAGQPLVLLHGALSTIEADFGALIPGFARDRQVIAIEQQAHGHSADIDRPLSTAQMVEDTAALLDSIQVAQADFFGYSMGGGLAIEMAIRHPGRVRKLVAAGGICYSPEGFYPEMLAGFDQMKPEDMLGTEWEKAYARVAPRPQDWTTLVAKNLEMDRGFTGWPADVIQGIQAPALIMIGDADIVRPEHVAQMFRLLGGGVIGDLVGLPRARLAILPGTTNVTIMRRTDWLASMVSEFLDAPLPQAG